MKWVGLEESIVANNEMEKVMSFLEQLRNWGGGCVGGQHFYSLAKDAAEIRNIARKHRPLRNDIISKVRPMFPDLDLTRVRIRINASLPADWVGMDEVEGMTFGYDIYFKRSGYQTDVKKLPLLIHELAHVDQVRQRGNDEMWFACEYGEGYLKAGNYFDNPLEVEARKFEDGLMWPDGTWLREESRAIWVICGRAKFHVPDPATFDRIFPSDAHLIQLWDGALSRISEMPIDGTWLREENGAIWVIYGHAKFHVPDPATFDRFFPSDAHLYQLWDGALSGISGVPVDGTLLCEENGSVWVIYGHAKFHVPDPSTYETFFRGSTPHELWNRAVDHIGFIPDDGTLFRETSSRSGLRNCWR